MKSRRLIASLDEQFAEVDGGGKAFHLSRLIRLGFAVPPGAVILDSAFQDHLVRSGAAPLVATLRLAESDDRRQTLATQIRQRILSRPVDEELVPQLQQLLKFDFSQTRYAVRSSALGEDSVSSSFAGQLDSFLNVDTPEALSDAIIRTWSSAWSERAVSYQHAFSRTLIRMGIVVQEQVPAKFAGVLFTESPAPSQSTSEILLEYVSGLGDKLVAGEVTPGRMTFSREEGKLLEHSHPSESHSQIDLLETETSVDQLVRESLSIEAAFGMPVDVEWAIAEGGKLYFLQARPITTRLRMRKVLWSNSNMSENYPEPVVPLLYSIATRSYTEYFRNLALGFGFSPRRISSMATHLDHIVGAFAGRLYYNLSSIHSFLALAPAGRSLCRFFDEFIGHRGGLANEAPETVAQSKLPLAEVLKECFSLPIGVLRQYIPIKLRIRQFERLAEEFAAESCPQALVNADMEELLRHFRRFLEIRFRKWNNAALADTGTMICCGALRLLLPKATPHLSQDLVYGKLLTGLSIASNKPVLELFELSRAIRADSKLRALFALEADAVRQALLSPEFADFAGEFEIFLERWGFRSSSELLLTVPSPRENVLPTIEILKHYVAIDGLGPESSVAENDLSRRKFEADLFETAAPPEVWPQFLPLMLYRFVFRIVLRSAQGSIRLRERARFQQARLYVRFRDVVLEIGRRLTSRGDFLQPDDVFFLTIDEVDQHLSGRSLFPDLLGFMIQERRSRHRAQFAVHPPERLCLSWGEYFRETPVQITQTEKATHATRTLAGVGASGGAVFAPARVLETAAEGGKLQPGEILVTQQTDPGWASVFPLVKGLVIERGGMLSHGAIIAREYGIPAVVGIRDVTSQVENGEKLHIDGDRGIVEIHR